VNPIQRDYDERRVIDENLREPDPEEVDDVPDSLQLWAKVKSEITEASDAILKANGLTWNELNRLEEEAMSLMGSSETVETQWGTIQKIPDRPIQYRLRKSSEDLEPTIFKKRLKLHKHKE
jgi:hypothetical protein